MISSNMGLYYIERLIRNFIPQGDEKTIEQVLKLACHAALPAALTAELVHLLRINFLPNSAPEIEFILLLSPLCHELGDDTYEIEPEIRKNLLNQLQVYFPKKQRIRAVAQMLVHYEMHYAPWQNLPELHWAQLFTALNVLEPSTARAWIMEGTTTQSGAMPFDQKWFVALQKEVEQALQLSETDSMQQETQDLSLSTTPSPQPQNTDEKLLEATTVSLSSLHNSDETLRIAIVNCQNLLQGWNDASTEDERAQHADRYKASLEQLWNLLADDLYAIARSWRKSNLATDVESLALSHFTEIIMALPRLKIDPTKNVRQLVFTLFRRSLITEYRTLNPLATTKPHDEKPETSVEPGTPAAQFWPMRGAETLAVLTDGADIPDPQSFDSEERIFRKLYTQAMMKTIREFWSSTLPPEDLSIIVARWEHDPPRPYQEIAATLGPGWTEANVRKRHQRTIERTRQYLKDNNLLGLLNE